MSSHLTFEERDRIVHWLATFVDRKSRFTLLFKVTRKDAEYVYRKARDRLAQLPDDKCHALTLDHGGEFAKHLSMARRRHGRPRMRAAQSPRRTSG